MSKHWTDDYEDCLPIRGRDNDTLIVDGKRVRKCCGRHGACQRQATDPEHDPFLCSPCYIVDLST